MPSAFAITADPKLPLDPDGRGKLVVTVTNISDLQRRGRLRIVALGETPPEWLKPLGEVEREFAVGETHAFTIQVVVPAGTAAGSYTFRPDMIAEDRPDTDSTLGPTIAMEVGPRDVTPPPPFRWWIVAVAAAVVVVVAVMAFLLLRPSEQVVVPNVVGKNVAEAEAIIAEAGLAVGERQNQVSLTAPNGTVIDQSPEPDERVAPGTAVDLVVARRLIPPDLRTPIGPVKPIITIVPPAKP